MVELMYCRGREMCKKYNVKIRGVILNKVQEDKVDMLWDYFPKALKRWDVPLLGVVPDLQVLEYPCMNDFEELFQSKLLSGDDRRLIQFKQKSLVTSGLRRFLIKLSSNKFNETLFVTHASRNDIILGFLSHSQNYERKTGKPFGGGLILTGKPPQDQPQDHIMEIIAGSKSPVLYAPLTTYQTMNLITNFTGIHFFLSRLYHTIVAKFNASDTARVLVCAKHYEKYINFDALLA